MGYIVKEEINPQTGKVFMMTLIPDAVVVSAVVTKESSSPTQMDLKIQRKLETLLAKESLTDFEALTLEKLQEIKKIYINESLTQGK